MRRFLMMSMLLVVSWGCASAPEAMVTQVPATAVVDTLSGEWMLTQMNGESLAELTVSLEFQDTMLAGQGFCNNYNATITVEGASLTVDPAIGATKMACPEDDTMQREQTYFETLTKVKTYAEVDGRLELRDESGTPILVYQR